MQSDRFGLIYLTDLVFILLDSSLDASQSLHIHKEYKKKIIKVSSEMKQLIDHWIGFSQCAFDQTSHMDDNFMVLLHPFRSMKSQFIVTAWKRATISSLGFNRRKKDIQNDMRVSEIWSTNLLKPNQQDFLWLLKVPSRPNSFTS